MTLKENLLPEQAARVVIDEKLRMAGWKVVSLDEGTVRDAPGVAMREVVFTNGKRADYVLFVDAKPVGIVEAKPDSHAFNISVVEEQSRFYANSKIKGLEHDPMRFVYECAGDFIQFTDYMDPKPRSRRIFNFQRPETLRDIMEYDKPLRARLLDIPELDSTGLRQCQVNAITNLERSLKGNRKYSLVQMATGAGKTFTAITSIYRLLKYGGAKRALFLVDTLNLGKQAESEFAAYVPNDDNRKFNELYAVQRLTSSYIPPNVQVCISTIQRLYSILRGEELDETAEQDHPAEMKWSKDQRMPVSYKAEVPPEFFDFIVIDECHRSIYNVWKQVLEYFDSFLIGLTATPDKRTFGFFHKNVVSEYTHEDAIADAVNVGHDLYVIETKISKQGGVIWKGQQVDKRERLTRRRRWTQLDEDVVYSKEKLDKDVVNFNQIRTVIRTFRQQWKTIFPGREHLPKTLVFAKTDSHADDIIRIFREEFEEGNDFCKKLTYKNFEADKVLAAFRNDFYPRVAVTVDMVATGTDVKPLECLLFMRDVRSRTYFEQMKGRGTRTLDLDGMRRVSPSARTGKTHFVIVDAVGVTQSLKTDSRPLERAPSVPLKDLLRALQMGGQSEDLFLSLASRLARLERQLAQPERDTFTELSGGVTIRQAVKRLMDAYNPDVMEEKTKEIQNENPRISSSNAKKQAQQELIDSAVQPFNGKTIEFIEQVRRQHEQIIDNVNDDEVIRADWAKNPADFYQDAIRDFDSFLREHKDELTAISIFYDQPVRRRDITFKMLKDVLAKLKQDRPRLAPKEVWEAYAYLDKVEARSPVNELTILVSLLRRVSGVDQALTPYDAVVDRNFQAWVFDRHKGSGPKFTKEQMEWLRMIKDHMIASYRMDQYDLELTPFNDHGGRSKMYALFGDQMNDIIKELNDALVA